MKSWTFGMGLATALFAGGSIANAANPVIWNNGPAAAPANGFTSQDGGPPTVFSSQTADDFLFQSAMNLTDLHWTGQYSAGGALGQAFNIRIYASNGAGDAPTGGPGDPSATALATYNTGAGGAGEVIGVVAGTFDYTYNLPAPFVAAAGVHYWISIQSVNVFPPQWYWSVSTLDQLSEARLGSTGALAIPFWTNPVTATIDDMAFNLTGTPVPAPGALALLGLASMMSTRRRRA